MKISSLFKSTVLAGAALAATMVTSSAFATPVFTVNQAFAGASGLVTADGFNFSYGARITSTVVGSGLGTAKLADNDDPFVEKGFMALNGFTLNNNGVNSQVNSTYKLYALFTINGEADPVNATAVNAYFTSSTMTLYLDKGADTVLGLDNSASGVTRTNTGNDIVLANMTMNSVDTGNAGIKTTGSKGSFEVTYDIALTGDGLSFFNGSQTFLQTYFSGTTTEFMNPLDPSQTSYYANLLDGGVTEVKGGGITTIQGTPVPEPSTALLAGLGLIGLVATSRRRNKKA